MIELYITIYAWLLGAEVVHELITHRDILLALLAIALAWFIEHDLDVYVHFENSERGTP